MENIQVAVPKEIYEAGLGLAAFINVCRQALKDGFKAGDDIPAILTSAMTDLLPHLQAITAMEEEFKADEIAAANALLQALVIPMVKELVEKKAA